MVEFGTAAGDPQADRLAGSQEAFPGQPRGPLLEFRESGSKEEIAQPGQDPAGTTQLQVGAIKRAQVPLEEHASGFEDRLDLQGAQFLGGEFFQSGGGDDEE